MPNLFPTDNRSTSLTIDFHYLRRMVGKELAYGYVYTAADDTEQQEIDETIDEGLRSYYFPPPLPPPYSINMGSVHEWSFMRPIYEFRTSSGQREYALPAEFERLVDDVYYAADENDYYTKLRLSNPRRLMQMANKEQDTGPPRYVATRADDTGGVEEQRQLMTLHPTPDSTYKLKMQYQALAQRLTTTQPYPLGGQAHGSGILAACLAAAESRRMGAQGPRYVQFLEKLAGNIIRDLRRGSGLLGYNGNGVPGVYSRGELRSMDAIYSNHVTYGAYGTY